MRRLQKMRSDEHSRLAKKRILEVLFDEVSCG